MWLVVVRSGRGDLCRAEADAVQKLGHDARAVLVPLSERLVVHLVGQHRVREVVLLQKSRRGRVEKRVDVPDRLVRAVSLLEINGRRMRNRGVQAAGAAVAHRGAHRGAHHQRRGSRVCDQGTLGRQPFRRGAVTHGREARRRRHGPASRCRDGL